MTLDLKAPADQAKLVELARRSDALIENFRPGTLEKWGVGPERLQAANPALVICRVTGYGQTGPYRDRPGFARIAHAVGGLTHLAGMPDGPPVTPGSSSLADYFSGMYGALGIMLALRVAEQTGKGQVIDVALYRVHLPHPRRGGAGLSAQSASCAGARGVMTRQVCPHGHFRCGDGKYVAIACTSDRMWDRMARNVLDRAGPGREPSEDEGPAGRARPDRRRGRGVHAGAPDGGGGANSARGATCPAGRSTRSPTSSRTRISRRAARSSGCEHPELGEIAVPATFPHLSETPGRIDRLGPVLGDFNDRLDALLADESEMRKRT